MTRKEKLLKLRPQWTDEELTLMCKLYCPSDFDICDFEEEEDCDGDCENCWNMEAKE